MRIIKNSASQGVFRIIQNGRYFHCFNLQAQLLFFLLRSRGSHVRRRSPTANKQPGVEIVTVVHDRAANLVIRRRLAGDAQLGEGLCRHSQIGRSVSCDQDALPLTARRQASRAIRKKPSSSGATRQSARSQERTRAVIARRRGI